MSWSVEAKSSRGAIGPAMRYFKQKLGARYALQVVWDEPYLDVDCFASEEISAVPAAIFLSQLP